MLVNTLLHCTVDANIMTIAILCVITSKLIDFQMQLSQFFITWCICVFLVILKKNNNFLYVDLTERSALLHGKGLL